MKPLYIFLFNSAARLTKPLGILLGEFLAELTRRGLHPDKLELLGGSLGAHIASYAATKYHELTHLKPSRLTGNYYFFLLNNLFLFTALNQRLCGKKTTHNIYF